MRETTRLAALDGLRGVAAVVVVVHHALLTFPALADGYFDRAASDPLAWSLTYTPLHAFWAGPEAVYLFFVLSGVVLVLPVLRKGREFSWVAYYPRRILRLYLPVIAAVLFGALTVALVPRFEADGLGAWLNGRTPTYTPERFLRDIFILDGSSGVISPLWSLRWEVLFSLLLPVFVVIAVVLRRFWWPKVVAAFAAILIGSLIDSDALFYLPIFALGALLIAEWERIGEVSQRLSAKRGAWPAILVCATLLTTSTWMLAGVDDDVVQRTVAVLPVLGVTLFVIAAGHYRPVQRCLEGRVVGWLGMISFALYLVHEPIIIAARLLTFPLSPWVGILISIPLSFVVAWAFARLVEQPAHRLSVWAGRAVEKIVGRAGVRAEARR